MQPSCVLHDGAPPRDRHGQEQGVQSRVVEALPDVPPCREDQEFLAIGYGGPSRQRLPAFLRADTSLQHNQVSGERAQAASEKIETITVEGPNYVSESRGRAGKQQGQSLPVSPLRTAAMPLAGVELQSLASSVVGGVRRFQLADTGLLSQNIHRPDDGAGQGRSRIVIDAGPPHDHRQLMDSSGGWVVE